MRQLFIDADACSVKSEAYRVAARHNLATFVVTCQAMRDPGLKGVTLVVVREGPDLADDWIAERIGPGDVCISDDIPLAARCVKRGACVVTCRGRLYHEGNIGEALATRDLLEQLRNQGMLSEASGGPSPFCARDRAKFFESIEKAVRALPAAE